MGRGPEQLSGIAGSPGVAIGTAIVLGSRMQQVARRHVEPPFFDSEVARFKRAVGRARMELRQVATRVPNVSTAHSVLEAYALMVDDPMLSDEVERRIRDEKRCAEWAVLLAIETIAAQIAESRDPYLRERSRDIELVGEHVLRGFEGSSAGNPRIPRGPIVLVARDLSPVDTAGIATGGPGVAGGLVLPGSTVVAFVTERGTRTSHTSITARALKLPAVVGLSDVFENVATGDLVIVDGLRGVVRVRPDDETLREAELRVEKYRALSAELALGRERAATTRDGARITVRANVEVPEEAREARDAGAEGVGLYRTEYLYIDRVTPPTEDEQTAAFKAVVDAMPASPIILRTFDVGGDKFATTFKLPVELNPMLGLRAVRLAVSRPEVFLEHLRAMVRAASYVAALGEGGEVRVMIPMVSTIGELRWARQMLDRAIAQLCERGEAPPPHIPLGVMIEVPAAALLAEHFAREAEFLSIGTNDLIQYSLAVDRASRRLAHLASPFDPSIARLISNVVQAGDRHGRSVSVCGAMAGDPLTALLLLGLGVREFSMEVAALAEIRETFRRASVAEAEDVAARALEVGTADEVESLLVEAFGTRLADILSGEVATA
ncbi:MAG TPA: phosphoenolpyruvate--protein phosphotransferase [Polyangiaceae bacterium]|nr:phosphoenolpyruvate--protein phosphotransferase [Polyangiaceae bacterium]